MVGRGALIRPWLFAEFKAGRGMGWGAEERVTLVYRRLVALMKVRGAAAQSRAVHGAVLAAQGHVGGHRRPCLHAASCARYLHGCMRPGGQGHLMHRMPTPYARCRLQLQLQPLPVPPLYALHLHCAGALWGRRAGAQEGLVLPALALQLLPQVDLGVGRGWRMA